jgi:hypothetical protein
MIFGMTTFTFVHVVISLIAIATGIVVVAGLLTGQAFSRWTAVFLLTTAATSITGFGFPFTELLPSHIFGIITLVTMVAGVPALYFFRLAGPWRWIYVVTAVFVLYLNVFVLVVQFFRKIPALHALAPTESEPPFAVAQLVVLVVFVIIGVAAVRKYHRSPRLAA